MKKNFLLLVLIITLTFLSFTTGEFRKVQQKFSRVRTAYAETEEGIKKMLSEKKIPYENFEIFLRAFKEEQKMELWARNKGNEKWILIKTYSICAVSGDPGPKRKRGDGQIPEGFYHIETFNPQSNFYLSLKLNYPNTSDRIIGSGDLGGDIFIHGSCVTIGCMPMTDSVMKEMYVLAVEAKDKGQNKIPVHVFPFKLNDENWQAKKKIYQENPQLISFWENIKKGYDMFEKNKILPAMSVLQDGKYSFR